MNHQYADQACQVEPFEKSVDYASFREATAIYLLVNGMGCPHCATRINNRLLRLEGVLFSEVLYDECFATVVCDPDIIQPLDLIQAVADADNSGYHHYEAKFLSQSPANMAVWETI